MLSVTLQLEKALRSARHAVDVADESVFDSMSQRKHDGAVAQARALAAVAQGVAVSQKLSAVHTALRARENETARYCPARELCEPAVRDDHAHGALTLLDYSMEEDLYNGHEGMRAYVQHAEDAALAVVSRAQRLQGAVQSTSRCSTRPRSAEHLSS